MTVSIGKQEAHAAIKLATKIMPTLAGQEPNVQGGVLAHLVSIWIVGHAPPLREELLKGWIELVRELIPANDRALFGLAGHPAKPQ
jgi:hypothetical protein